MTEIRPIQEHEAEPFLGLLCQVFDLDYGRAHSIFFTEPLFDLERKWALFENGKPVSILTTVPLEFGWGHAIGIAGVATEKERQGRGLAGKLLMEVIAESRRAGEGAVLLFAKDTRLYERLGFRIVDRVVRGEIESAPEEEIPFSLDFEQIRQMYDGWAAADPNRLRRNALRWKYWKWNLRVCTPFGDGYLCFEAGIIREIVTNAPPADWVLPAEAEWLGLESMARRLGTELKTMTPELSLMAYDVPGTPQFFMTDQF
ncbi:MAG TPA: GNAT family N-acetyltransferase [Fimbriimonadaceae bacterium]|nr:GNAT family N-acetyltransferase [Fimbriimonadaceae bacterium]